MIVIQINLIFSEHPHWTTWGAWGACSVTCGSGTRSRERTCDGGKIGEGSCVPTTANKEVGVCQVASCPISEESFFDIKMLLEIEIICHDR